MMTMVHQELLENTAHLHLPFRTCLVLLMLRLLLAVQNFRCDKLFILCMLKMIEGNTFQYG